MSLTNSFKSPEKSWMPPKYKIKSRGPDNVDYVHCQTDERLNPKCVKTLVKGEVKSHSLRMFLQQEFSLLYRFMVE